MNRGEPRLNGLDHLRAFAIGFVFLSHYAHTYFARPHWLAAPTEFAWTGVDLFFVLSGYLIGGHLLNDIARGRRILIGEFYIKRFLRIIPVYLVVVAVYFVMPALRETTGIQPLWKFLTFTQNLGFDGQLGRAFSHAWSLCVEEHFYMVLPVLLLSLALARRHHLAIWVAGVVFVGGLAVRFAAWKWLVDDYPGWYEWVYYPTYSRLDGLLVGVAAAATQIFAPARWRQLTRHPYVLLLTGLALLACAYVICVDRTGFASSVFSFPLIAAGYGSILIAAVSPDSILYRVRSRLTAFVAAVSYCLYLSHKIVIYVCQTALSSLMRIDGVATLLLCVTASLATALVLHVSVERPFMNLRAVVLRSRQQMPPAPN